MDGLECLPLWLLFVFELIVGVLVKLLEFFDHLGWADKGADILISLYTDHAPHALKELLYTGCVAT